MFESENGAFRIVCPCVLHDVIWFVDLHPWVAATDHFESIAELFGIVASTFSMASHTHRTNDNGDNRNNCVMHCMLIVATNDKNKNGFTSSLIMCTKQLTHNTQQTTHNKQQHQIHNCTMHHRPQHQATTKAAAAAQQQQPPVSCFHVDSIFVVVSILDSKFCAPATPVRFCVCRSCCVVKES